MRVLVAEDEERLRSVLERALRESGYAVDAYADGESAAFAAETDTFDLLILDAGGLQMAEQVLADLGALQAISDKPGVKLYGFCASEEPLTEQCAGCVAQEPESYGSQVIDQIKGWLGLPCLPAVEQAVCAPLGSRRQAVVHGLEDLPRLPTRPVAWEQ